MAEKETVSAYLFLYLQRFWKNYSRIFKMKGYCLNTEGEACPV